MVKRYKISKAPYEVHEYFSNKFPKEKGFDYILYKYKSNGVTIYAGEVFRNGKLFDNSIQENRDWYYHQITKG